MNEDGNELSVCEYGLDVVAMPKLVELGVVYDPDRRPELSG
jgi:hypothetical protein